MRRQELAARSLTPSPSWNFASVGFETRHPPHLIPNSTSGSRLWALGFSHVAPSHLRTLPPASSFEFAIAYRRLVHDVCGIERRRIGACESAADGARLSMRERGFIPFTWNRFVDDAFERMSPLRPMPGQLQSSTRRQRVGAGRAGDRPLRRLAHRLVVPAPAARWRAILLVRSFAGHDRARSQVVPFEAERHFRAAGSKS